MVRGNHLKRNYQKEKKTPPEGNPIQGGTLAGVEKKNEFG